MIQPPLDLRRFEALIEIVKALRGPDGCPWDKEQTHRTLAPYAIEESHELAEAIEDGNLKNMISELGDVLLQVALHAEIGRQEGRFSIEDVIASICEKMVRRHPHVFADGSAEDSQDVLRKWADIKKAEKAAAGVAPTHAFDIPKSIPALLRSQKIGSKTKDVRFDWSDWKGALEKADEEMRELREACEGDSTEAQEHELGDALFSLAQVARHLGLDAEQSLRVANARFEKRYVAMREFVDRDGREFKSLSNEEMEAYWGRAKALERKN